MDNVTMTLHMLAAEMANKTGYDRRAIDAVARALTTAVTETIATGSPARIKGIGTFEATPDGDVIFTPAAELAEEVNAPFACFEPVELDDNVVLEDEPTEQAQEPEKPAEELQEPPTSNNDGSEISESSEISDIPETSLNPDPSDTSESPATSESSQTSESSDSSDTSEIPDTSETSDTSETADSSDSSNGPEPAEAAEAPAETQPVSTGQTARFVHAYDDEDQTFVRYTPRPAFAWGWAITGLAIGLILGITAGYFLQPRIDQWLAPTAAIQEDEDSDYDALNADAVPVTLPDSVLIEEHPDTATITAAAAQEAAAPVPEVTDTIRRNRFLTTMAREHYGQMEFWVYIYLANADKLGNPDRARPGTVVRIPQLSEYGIAGRTPAEIERAKKRADEIYAPYRK